ncbi:MAG: deoxyribonuclease IV [Phycisphaerales bacterium]|nr:deoxyribonuclease IV [Phycisphaerales bacterium]
MFGSHLSIAGSMTNALDEAASLGMDCVQVFTKNQQQWKVRPLEDEAIRSWCERVEDLGWARATVSHASYLINLASPDDELWAKSIDLMQVEIERCATLGIPFLVHHPGAFTTSTREEGHERIVRAYVDLFGRTRGVPVVSCLENTVGSGSNMGRTFEELASLREAISTRTGAPERVGFCFDTCHAHAGGYDLSTLAGGEEVLDAFDATCGLSSIRVVHVNDSMGAVGSRKDRHAHIGEGTIGGGTSHRALSRSGFGPAVRRLSGVPKILETPKGETEKGTPFDRLNLNRLRKLA